MQPKKTFKSSIHWHFWRNRLFLLTKNALLKRGPKNSGMGSPPPSFGQCPKENVFFFHWGLPLWILIPPGVPWETFSFTYFSWLNFPGNPFDYFTKHQKRQKEIWRIIWCIWFAWQTHFFPIQYELITEDGKGTAACLNLAVSRWPASCHFSSIGSHERIQSSYCGFP